ncbi:polysulfide reductase [Campylobacter sp. FMV-PI01]|uniref:Polysulfide reductase n=1 Tax=Campylobacter portucalensis TaxID=2608384 RepID=A0A6L5WFF2_9BACT|nr:NrfD/PsrC family molybdoenzyme membrane anchor subunit [Campylobacter portucalensis]MSN95768.1 polysulfide reductase [Campylobacter portucalensis]
MNNLWMVSNGANEIYWGWHIAIYLVLAGLSAGAIIISLLVKWNMHSDNTNSIWDSMVKAGAITAPIAISAGLLLLIAELSKPLSFYWILIKYNFTSVMSVGVITLLIFTPLSYLFALIIFEREIKNSKYLSFLSPILNIIRSFASLAKSVEYLLFILALGVGLYTGFLLGAAYKIPLWNTPVLPLLFLLSGFSSGIATTVLVGMTFFKGTLNKNSIKYLLTMDLRAVVFEIPLLMVLFLGLYFEGGSSLVAVKQALTHNSYGVLFWIGAFGVGLFAPILIAFTALKNHAYKPIFIVLDSICIVAGVVCLRFFFVYAGQVCLGV